MALLPTIRNLWQSYKHTKPSTLAMALLFIACVFWPRLASLGQILTVDEPLWLSRGQTFISALSVGDFGKTLVAGQPGVTTAWLVGLTSRWHSLAAAQASIAITSGILILVATYFLRQLLGQRWGLITGFFLALDPFLIAHSRVAHTDALLALFYLTSLLALLTGIATTREKAGIPWRYLGMACILAAGAIMTKLYGIILIPTGIAILAIGLWSKKVHWQKIIQVVLVWPLAMFLIIFIAWPALWTDSTRVYDYLFSRSSLHAEGTRSEETTSASWYYPREIYFRMAVPTVMFLPFTVWQWRRLKRNKHALITATLVACGLAYAIGLNISSDKSDRYVLFTHLAILSSAPLGLRFLANQLKRYSLGTPNIVLAGILLPLAYLAIDDIRLHPYYLAHYNRLYPIEQGHKLGWGEGLETAAAYIQNSHPGAKVFSYYNRVFSHFYDGPTEDISHVAEASGGYAILYRSMFERGPGAPETDIVNEFLNSPKHTVEKVITINGLPYVWIFPLQPSIHK